MPKRKVQIKILWEYLRKGDSLQFRNRKRPKMTL